AGIGDAKRDIARFDEIENFVVEPRFVAKLERGAHFRQFAKKRIQHIGIFFETRWQLKQNRAEWLAEASCNFQEVFQRVRAIAEFRPMGDFLRCFEREPETFRRKRFPIFDRLWRWDPMKSVIDFRRRESLGVKGQHFRCGQIFGIKIPFPYRILKTRGADPESHDKTSNAQRPTSNTEFGLCLATTSASRS